MGGGGWEKDGEDGVGGGEQRVTTMGWLQLDVEAVRNVKLVLLWGTELDRDVRGDGGGHLGWVEGIGQGEARGGEQRDG